MTTPSNFQWLAKIKETILKKNTVCGTFRTQFHIEIHWLNDNLWYHVKNWYSLMCPNLYNTAVSSDTIDPSSQTSILMERLLNLGWIEWKSFEKKSDFRVFVSPLLLLTNSCSLRKNSNSTNPIYIHFLFCVVCQKCH